jgi:uncharacterized protein YxjI
MPRILTFSNALLSLRGRIEIGDEQGRPVYEARGEFSLFSPTWRVHAQGQEVVRLRKRLLAWRPTWDVQLGAQRMVVDRKLLSFTRVHRVHGGPYDGATLAGNLWDLSFAITRVQQVLARARSKLLSLRDVHTVEVLGSAPADELFVVAAMLVVLLDKRDNKHD